MSIKPGQDSIYVVVSALNTLKTCLDQDLKTTAEIKDVLTRKTMKSRYIWWGKSECKTKDGDTFIEIPRDMKDAQIHMLKMYPKQCYTKETIQPLLPVIEDNPIGVKNDRLMG